MRSAVRSAPSVIISQVAVHGNLLTIYNLTDTNNCIFDINNCNIVSDVTDRMYITGNFIQALRHYVYTRGIEMWVIQLQKPQIKPLFIPGPGLTFIYFKIL